MARHLTAEGNRLVNPKSDACQQQRHGTGQHDDQHLLALKGTVSKQVHFLWPRVALERSAMSSSFELILSPTVSAAVWLISRESESSFSVKLMMPPACRNLSVS